MFVFISPPPAHSLKTINNENWALKTSQKFITHLLLDVVMDHDYNWSLICLVDVA